MPRADILTGSFSERWLLRIVGAEVGQIVKLRIATGPALRLVLDEVAYVDRGHVPQWALSARKERIRGPLGPLPTMPRPHRCPQPAVSKPTGLSEDDLLAVLGPPRHVPRTAVADEPLAFARSIACCGREKPPPQASHRACRTTTRRRRSAARAGAAFVHRRRVCPKCCEIAAFVGTRLPLLPDVIVRMVVSVAQGIRADEGRRPLCHYLRCTQTGRSDGRPLRRASHPR